MAQSAAPPKPTDTPPPAAPVPLILEAPATLDGLLDRLRSPDFVLLRGDHYRDLLKGRDGGPGGGEPIVESVAIRGRVDRRTAELEVEFRVASPIGASAWVPLRLDGLVLTSASEAGRVVPVRTVANGGWEAEVRGAGLHLLRVAFAIRVARERGGTPARLPDPHGRHHHPGARRRRRRLGCLARRGRAARSRQGPREGRDPDRRRAEAARPARPPLARPERSGRLAAPAAQRAGGSRHRRHARRDPDSLALERHLGAGHGDVADPLVRRRGGAPRDRPRRPRPAGRGAYTGLVHDRGAPPPRAAQTGGAGAVGDARDAAEDRHPVRLEARDPGRLDRGRRERGGGSLGEPGRADLGRGRVGPRPPADRSRERPAERPPEPARDDPGLSDRRATVRAGPSGRAVPAPGRGQGQHGRRPHAGRLLGRDTARCPGHARARVRPPLSPGRRRPARTPHRRRCRRIVERVARGGWGGAHPGRSPHRKVEGLRGVRPDLQESAGVARTRRGGPECPDLALGGRQPRGTRLGVPHPRRRGTTHGTGRSPTSRADPSLGSPPRSGAIGLGPSTDGPTSTPHRSGLPTRDARIPCRSGCRCAPPRIDRRPT